MKRSFAIGILLSLLAGGALAQSATPAKTEKATFAGGCFWCTEADFDKVEGVISTTSGYIGGKTENPTYQQVSAGRTGHTEAVEIVYDPSKVTFEKLLDVYWRSIDPFVKDRQFCDSGDMYRTAIFFHSPDQRQLAEKTKKAIESSGKFNLPVQTEIVAASKFYRAEDYHQDFHTKNPSKYSFYRWNCGRDQRLEQIWGKKTS
jgi:peptide-methionine (S)-S-oxide reductase